MEMGMVTGKNISDAFATKELMAALPPAAQPHSSTQSTLSPTIPTSGALLRLHEAWNQIYLEILGIRAHYESRRQHRQSITTSGPNKPQTNLPNASHTTSLPPLRYRLVDETIEECDKNLVDAFSTMFGELANESQVIQNYHYQQQQLRNQNQLHAPHSPNNLSQSQLNVKEHIWAPGLCIEYFLRNNILSILVDMVCGNDPELLDVPRGLRQLVIGLVGGLARELPPAFFFWQNINQPILKLLIQLVTNSQQAIWWRTSRMSVPTIFSPLQTREESTILAMLEGLTARIVQYPPLWDILMIDGQSPILELLLDRIEVELVRNLILALLPISSVQACIEQNSGSAGARNGNGSADGSVDGSADGSANGSLSSSPSANVYVLIILKIIGAYADIVNSNKEEKVMESRLELSKDLLLWIKFSDEIFARLENTSTFAELFRERFVKTLFCQTIKNAIQSDEYELLDYLILTRKLVESVKQAEIAYPLVKTFLVECQLKMTNSDSKAKRAASETTETITEQVSHSINHFIKSPTLREAFIQLFTTFLGNQSNLIPILCYRKNPTILPDNPLKESYQVHLQRCDRLFKAFGRLPLEIHGQEKGQLSRFYRRHLLWAEKTVGQVQVYVGSAQSSLDRCKVNRVNDRDVNPSLHDSNTPFTDLIKTTKPTSRELTLDRAEADREIHIGLVQLLHECLFDSMSRWWEEVPEWNLALAQCICKLVGICDPVWYRELLSDNVGISDKLGHHKILSYFTQLWNILDRFEKKFDQQKSDELLWQLANLTDLLVQSRPADPRSDPLYDLTWLVRKFSSSRATNGSERIVDQALNVIILGHLILRLVALVQVHALRPYVEMLYF